MSAGVELANVGVELIPGIAGADNITIGTSTITGGTTGRVLFDNAGVLGEYVVSGSGNVAMTTSPVLTTPTLGAALATSINGLILTTSTGTLTVANGKVVTVNSTLTLAGTDSTVMTFPSTSATIARTDAGQTFTGTQVFGLAQVGTSVTYTAAAAGPILKQGANGRVGTFAATGITPVVVANSSVAITDAIIISLNTPGGTVGVSLPALVTITAGVGFTVAALALDTSTYNYAIIKNAA